MLGTISSGDVMVSGCISVVVMCRRPMVVVGG
jgi:hypothetical protein